MRADILEAALTQEQRDKGYWLKESDDDIVELWHYEAFIGRWSRTGATIAELRATAQEHIANELGVNCWLPGRFIEGRCCERINACNYILRRKTVRLSRPKSTS